MKEFKGYSFIIDNTEVKLRFDIKPRKGSKATASYHAHYGKPTISFYTKQPSFEQLIHEFIHAVIDIRGLNDHTLPLFLEELLCAVTSNKLVNNYHFKPVKDCYRDDIVLENADLLFFSDDLRDSINECIDLEHYVSCLSPYIQEKPLTREEKFSRAELIREIFLSYLYGDFVDNFDIKLRKRVER